MKKKRARRKKSRAALERRRKLILKITGALLIALALFFGLFYINTIEVVGNSGKNYTNQEIIQMSLPGLWSKNSALLRMFRRKVDLKDVRFMESVEVEFRSNNSIRLHVNEKKPIGFVRLNGSDYYFDHEGVVLEIMSAEETSQLKQGLITEPMLNAEQTTEESEASSLEEGEETAGDESSGVLQDVTDGSIEDENVEEFNPNLADCPMVTGLNVTPVDAGLRFPVKDPSIFNTIQSLTKMIDKYSISPDYVELSEGAKGKTEMTLYYGNVRAALGSDQGLEEKVTRLAAILPKLEGRSGVLHLEEFTNDTINIVFDEDQ